MERRGVPHPASYLGFPGPSERGDLLGRGSVFVPADPGNFPDTGNLPSQVEVRERPKKEAGRSSRETNRVHQRKHAGGSPRGDTRQSGCSLWLSDRSQRITWGKHGKQAQVQIHARYQLWKEFHMLDQVRMETCSRSQLTPEGRESFPVYVRTHINYNQPLRGGVSTQCLLWSRSSQWARQWSRHRIV